MGRRKSAAEFRAFLRALGGTGNVRLAALAAGMDAGTAYDHRIRDDGFAARWDAALAKGKAAAAAGKARAAGRGAEAGLVVRKTRHGTQLIRAGAGRWSDAAERRFLAALERTGCVRAAARACGFSTTALYERRKHYPDFAERWRAAEARAAERLPGLLVAAGIAAFDPEAADEKLPAVNVDQAIAICRMKGMGGEGRGRRGRNIPPEPSIEAVRSNILRKLDAIEAHEKKKAGEDPASHGPEEEKRDD